MNPKHRFRAASAALLAAAAPLSIARAQGLATVFPMSKAVGAAGDGISFVIQNQSENDVDFTYAPECDVDGKELSGEACTPYFEATLNTDLKDGKFKLPARGKVEGRVSLKTGVSRFALFKPLFEPAPSAADKQKPGVSFEFGYQPGYLFVLKAPSERVTAANFSSLSSQGTQRLKWVLPVSGVTVPQLLNVSAKLSEKGSNKTLKFLPLAKEKIFDPKRGELLLEADLGKTAVAKTICYELFVNNKFAPDSYKISGCQEP